jgi:hypothetical protein
MIDPPKTAVEAQRLIEDALRDLISKNRPTPKADENGDKHCLRLWPVARCVYVSGHYGGCVTP